ncbi:hypothetical protein FQA18_11975 [Haloferax volcanii]|uniref:Uncharacterized protein n=1 Tax=Haloferax volcanii TaxID=2246 RepID=A0A558G9I0_HALVO|nr:hypothetical protein FQA18_11975 [Haloferax volcanii]
MTLSFSHHFITTKKPDRIEKMYYFIRHSKPYIGDEDVYQELKNKFPIVKKRLECLVDIVSEAADDEFSKLLPPMS